MGRPALLLTGAIAYAALSHALLLRDAAGTWSVAVLLGPLLASATALAWRTRRPVALAAIAAATAGLVVAVRRDDVLTLSRLYVLQHAGVHAVLGLAFGLTLGAPRSMIARVAERVHPLTPAMVAYTRQVTLAWTLYFAGMALLSLAVYALAPWGAWSLLASVATPAAIALLFICEYALRYRLHPEFERVPLRAAFSAWRQRPAPADLHVR